jgi:hypothetical protein
VLVLARVPVVVLIRVLALVVVLVVLVLVPLVPPYVERFMHHFGGNVIVPQCVIFEGIVRTGPPPK